MPINPVRYDPSVEQVDPDEESMQQELVAILSSIIEKTNADHGHAMRSVHAKSHALLEGTLTVAGDLPAEYAQGLFAAPATYPVVMRISTAPGDPLPDSISTPRGVAIKVIGVDGRRMPGSESDTTQDFVLAAGKAFAAPRLAPFVKQLRLLAATTDRMERTKKVISALFRTTERALEALGTESAALKGLGGNRNTNPLGEELFSAVPIRYGDYIAKVGLYPSSASFNSLRDKEIDIDGRDDALRDELNEFLRQQGGEWDLRVQLCTSLDTMPVENAAVEWPEDQSPYVTVARITVEPQPAWNAARSRAVDDSLAFSPWHGLDAHRPLGQVMRARRPAYAASASLRGKLGGCPIHEPTEAPVLP